MSACSLHDIRPLWQVSSFCHTQSKFMEGGVASEPPPPSPYLTESIPNRFKGKYCLRRKNAEFINANQIFNHLRFRGLLYEWQLKLESKVCKNFSNIKRGKEKEQKTATPSFC